MKCLSKKTLTIRRLGQDFMGGSLEGGGGGAFFSVLWVWSELPACLTEFSGSARGNGLPKRFKIFDQNLLHEGVG